MGSSSFRPTSLLYKMIIGRILALILVKLVIFFRHTLYICIFRWFRIFLDFKVSRYCEGWDSQQGRLRTTSILVRAFWNFKCKVLKYSRNCSLHNTLIPNLVKPLMYIYCNIWMWTHMCVILLLDEVVAAFPRWIGGCPGIDWWIPWKGTGVDTWLCRRESGAEKGSAAKQPHSHLWYHHR